MKNNQSGRSMIEMIGVIAIIGILTVGGIAGYSKGMEMWRINRTSNQISQIVANIRALYRGQMDFRGLDSEKNYTAIDRTHMFPPEMGSEGNYQNPFSGKVELYTSGYLMSSTNTDDDSGEVTREVDKLAFMLVYHGLPKSACLGLATKDWGTGSAGGLVAMSVNTSLDDITAHNCRKTIVAGHKSGNTITPGAAIICEGQGLLSPTDLSSVCNLETNNTLYFKYY